MLQNNSGASSAAPSYPIFESYPKLDLMIRIITQIRIGSVLKPIHQTYDYLNRGPYALWNNGTIRSTEFGKYCEDFVQITRYWWKLFTKLRNSEPFSSISCYLDKIFRLFSKFGTAYCAIIPKSIRPIDRCTHVVFVVELALDCWSWPVGVALYSYL